MFYLNTGRHLAHPASDETIARLLSMVDSEIVPKAASLAGMRSIAWMISTDRTWLQAFSGWDTAEDLPRAEHSAQHVENSKVIAELLGGLAEPQTHTHYQLLAEKRF